MHRTKTTATSRPTYNVNNYEYDCTKKCKLRNHGQQITASLTKRCVPSDKLAAFIAKTCCNFCDINDYLGRSAVHIAASVDRYEILEWLLNQGAAINSKDRESGSSALHRSIYYGCIDCAVLLIRYGSNLDLLDADTRSPLQNCCRLCDFSSIQDKSSSNELLVWGSNKNYNLGIGNEEGTLTPQPIEIFRRAHISIEYISLGTYHSLFVDKKGLLYAVGHGKGGRLGNKTENSLPEPTKVKIPLKNVGERIIDVSTSRKHSLILTNKSTVFTCGLNEDMQLGIRGAPEKLIAFKEVVTLRDFGVKDLIKVIARDSHSIAYSRTEMYVWGTNNGQFGWNSKSDAVIPVPREVMKITDGTELVFVESNNSAIACYTTLKCVVLFYNYKIRSIKTPQIESLKSVSIVGGDNSKSAKGSVSALKLLMLTETNVLFIWYEMTQQYLRCTFPHVRVNQIDKIFYKANQVLILSRGDVYTGKCHQVKVQDYQEGSRDAWLTDSQTRNDICNDQKIQIELNRIPHLDRVEDIFCDDEFKSFAILQESNTKYFNLPTLEMERYTFKKLLTDANEFDAIHDVVFHVDEEHFNAHKFIVYSRSPGLRDIIKSYPSKDVHLNFKGLTAKMFELILKNIYTNYCIVSDDLDDIQQSLGPECPADRRQVLQLFLNFVDKFQLTDLANYVQKFLHDLPRTMEPLDHRFKRLKRQDFPELYDVTIKCAGGVEMSAHKCILVSRLEYFDLMFTHSWSEQTTISLTTVPPEYMIPIVDYLYTLDREYFRKQNYSETFLYNMVVFCDQFFIESLRKVCEVLILEKINIRKCGDMLDFASLYNCKVLKYGCMDFICQNLYRVLSQKSLECCEPEVLKSINAHYRQMFKKVFDYRMITPDSAAVDDGILLSFVDDFEVDLDYRMDEEEIGKSQAKHKQKENKIKQSARQYEQDAINSMRQMNLRDAKRESMSETSKVVEEAKEASQRILAEHNVWLKAADKKKNIKKDPVSVTVTSNDVLKTESKPKEEFVSLVQSEKEPIPPERTPIKDNHFNLADFTPLKGEKLSQKQRKRLSSESWRSEPSPVTPTKPVAMPKPQTPNAWGVCSPPSTSGGLFDASSPVSLPFVSPKARTESESSHSTSGTSFKKILEDQTKQREYVDRMKNKSLVLTQIEEAAITELREFYNVDNTCDEIITIERKSRPLTMNYAVWQRN